MKNKAAFGVIIGITLFFSGCFVYNPTADFVKQRYTNSVSYFNTFYNAQRAFDEAEEEVLTAQKEFREKPSFGRQFTIPPTARTKFTSSIEKNSKVLSFFPTSKWVDDALLMIGKAYYYLEDNVRAERKFLELAVKFPESELIDESTLFLGRSLLRQKKIAEGVKRLEELLEKTKTTDENIAGLAAYDLAHHYFSQNNFEVAEKFYSQSLPWIDDEEQQALTQFQIAQCLENLKHYEEAELEYEKVNEYSPGYTLMFNADLAKARTLVQRNKFQEAIEMMEDMLGDTKNTEFYVSIHYEIANALLAQGERIAAMHKYQYIDTTFARTDEAAKSYFALAQIFEFVDPNYDSARVYYGKARLEFPSSKITQEATQKAEVFTKYDTYRKDLIRFDSLIVNAKQQKEKADSVNTAADDSISIHTKDSTITEVVDPKSRKATKPVKKSDAKKDSIPTFDSTKIKAQIAKDLAYKQLLDSLQRSVIKTKFELGGLFFLELPVPDSALYWFDQVVTQYPQSEFAPRALYTIAEIYRTIKEQPQYIRDSLHSLIISSYPTSPYAQESRKILGIPIVELQKDTVVELLDRAEAYADARDFIAAIKTYQEIVDKHSTSPLTPKALYSAGWHYENSLMKSDSALVLYRRLISRYPVSQYATSVRSKINEYDNEQARIEQEKQKLIEAEKLKEQIEKEKKDAALNPSSIQQDSLNRSHTVQPDSLLKPAILKPDSLSTVPREKI